MNIRDLDFNLLICFDVLIAERHVTHAAERLNMSQSAMSSALAKLRDVFNDALLVRSPHGMVPTTRALELIEPVRRVIREMEEVIQPSRDFAPAQSNKTFAFIGTDYAEYVLLPRLIERLEREAPGVKIIYRPPNPKHLVELMAAGEVDLCLSYLPDPPPALHARFVYHDRFVCLVRRDHPAVREALTIGQFAELSHVQVLPKDLPMFGTPIDEALSAQNIVRKIAVWEPSFLVIPHLIATSSLITTVPERLARMCAEMLPLKILEPPLQLPALNVSLYWHDRTHLSPAHQWLRNLVHAVAREVSVTNEPNGDAKVVTIGAPRRKRGSST
jgi:DNA-binding transcriptional LysR family regulator